MKIIFFFMMLIVTIKISSCGKDEDKIKSYSFKDIFINEDSIRLEINEKSFIEPVGLFQSFKESKWYLTDFYSIYLFDKDGNFLSKFGQRGEGPKEFELIEDIKFDNNKNLLVYDVIQQKITMVDTNLNFIKTKKIISKSCSIFYPIGDNYYFFNRNFFEDSLTLKVFDSSFNYLYSILSFPFNSVTQIFIGGNKPFTYAADINKILVIHLYDPYLKIISLDNENEIKNIPLNFSKWKEVNDEKVRKYFPEKTINTDKIHKYLKDKLRCYNIFYIGNNRIILEYSNFENKEYYYQYFKIDNKEVNYVINKPSDMDLYIVKNGFAFFLKYNYENDRLTNPTIIKYRINHDFYK